VKLEVIISHEVNLSWKEFQYFGRIIDRNLFPVKSQEIIYYLLADSYIIKIDSNGNCFILLSTGELPPRDPVVIPIRVFYKRS
jgi:uncharacterized protein YqkB